MGRRGVAPKPTALRILEGDRPCRINRNEPTPREALPEPPEWLCERARELWDHTFNELKAMRMVTAADREALAAYCEWTARFIEAVKLVQDEGVVVSGTVSKHPGMAAMREAGQMMTKYAAEFGLTPRARAEIRLPTEQDDDELNRLLS